MGGCGKKKTPRIRMRFEIEKSKTYWPKLITLMMDGLFTLL